MLPAVSSLFVLSFGFGFGRSLLVSLTGKAQMWAPGSLDISRPLWLRQKIFALYGVADGMLGRVRGRGSSASHKDWPMSSICIPAFSLGLGGFICQLCVTGCSRVLINIAICRDY